MKRLSLAALAMALCGISGAAEARPGYTYSNITIYAGPATNYPTISYIRRGTAVEIYDCVPGWSWCEVETGPYRGWVPATHLRTYYRNRPVQVVQVARAVPIPVVSFNIGTYWDRHYRDKPFYRDRDRWDHNRGPRWDRDHDGRDWDRDGRDRDGRDRDNNRGRGRH